MAARLAVGALQPNGQVIPEATFDAQHVADAILHIANLPTTVSVLEMTIMYASWYSYKARFLTRLYLGRLGCLMLAEDNLLSFAAPL